MDSTQKVALITGGGQGIGKGLVKKYLENGYSVVLAELDEEAGNETAFEYRPLGQVVFVPTDVREKKSIINVVDKVLNMFGRLDVVINNAAIANPGSKPLLQVSLEEWSQMLQCNLTSAFLFAKYTQTALKQAKGALINIASTRALMSEPNSEAYAASKGGLVALTHALAISLAPDVRVNCISPGWINTCGWQKSSVKKDCLLKAEDHAQHPCGRVGEVADVANLAYFLTDPQNNFITGQNFVVDGGMTKKMIYV